MKLFHDEFDDIFVWVLDSDENVELSPRFDTAEAAAEWKEIMIQTIVVPSTITALGNIGGK